MRFSHFLKYNAVPEWQNHYMDYSELKNLIYTLQTDELKNGTQGNQPPERGPVVVEEEEAMASSSKHFAKKLFKNKFFGKKSSSTPNSQHLGDEMNVGKDNGKKEGSIEEETYELKDINQQSILENGNGNTGAANDKNGKDGKANKSSPLRKVKEKFFESRRSSLSSEGQTLFNTYDVFVNSLTVEKFKVDDFYKRMEAKFYERFETLIKDLEKEGMVIVTRPPSTNFPSETPELINSPFADSRASGFEVGQVKTLHATHNGNNAASVVDKTNSFMEHSEDGEDEDDFVDEDDDVFSESGDNTALLNYSQFNVKSQRKSILKQSIINLYIDLCQLKSFIELNRMGFSKITKKSDKVLYLNTREDLIHSGEFFKDTFVFQDSTLTILNGKIAQLVEFFAMITGHERGDTTQSKQELKAYLHDHIVWERSNTWKDMLGLLSQNKQITTDIDDAVAKAHTISKLDLEYYEYPLPKPIPLKFTTLYYFKIPKLFFTLKAFKIAFIIVITAILLAVPTFHDPAQHRCMALVECVAFLWASEAIPLHVTAFLVPLLVVLFRVMKDSNGHVMKAADASSTILATMWSSTIMILLAGFTLGEVLAQYNVAKILASWLLAFAGVKPRNVLLMAMAVVFFLSMWISNVAAPVLTYSLLSPLLDPLDADNDFGKALVMGVALAANIGGLASPISSPQNVISMQYLKPYGIGWGQFFAVALPTGILGLLLVWGLMCISFKINLTKLEKFTPIRTQLTMKQYFIVVISVGTILLWCVESQIEHVWGSSGIIACLPIVLFFGTGLLSTQDLNSFPWSIVILAMGGVALGKAVSSSGLLSLIARSLQRRIEHDTTLAVLCIFGVLMLVVGTFVSHTVSAIIIIPLVQEVGDKLPDPKAAPILVFGCALLASAGMGLASSGFPNITAISKVDKKGDRYLNMGTFISRGVPASLLVFLCVITLGYGIMHSVLKPVAST
ncbi:Inorganic phosphate transporter PHO87 [Nakaseomyces bracarensis]|uniref:Inorganic phosphate transporter PHO87 n=1 Tax=Nakaseomyces bracarensis TaxID=273131 RepID=A0ABR4NR16_9SACH